MKSAEGRTIHVKFLLIFALALLIFTGCSTQSPFILENLDTAKKLVQNYYESGQFDNECKEVIDDAIAKIEQLTIDDKSVVVFDVDETALSNYRHTKEIGFGFVSSLWHQWMLKADGTAIPQTKRFYDWLISKNIRVIFVTGRYQEVKEATRKNLINQGFVKFDTLIVRKPSEQKIPAAEYKAQKRDELTKEGYNIIASIGDQWSDLVGGNAGIKIKLPNYLYLID